MSVIEGVDGCRRGKVAGGEEAVSKHQKIQPGCDEWAG